ncbi:MAG: glycosyltransferase [Cyclobacteriaceae bacterium]|nr:glycosyltransferase [Cyclobacteriaceae bacterium]
MCVIPSLEIGGAENQLVTTINELATDNEIFLIVLSARVSLLAQVNLPRERILILKKERLVTLSGNFLPSSFVAAFKISQFLRRKNVRLVIAHLPIAHWVCRLAVNICRAGLRKVHLVNYHHSMNVLSSDLLFSKLFIPINKVLSHVSDAGNICVSNAVAKDIARFTHLKNQPVTIYNFAMDDRTNSNTLYLNKSGFWIVIPGRLEAVKGQLHFIQNLISAFYFNEFSHLNLKFIFVGGGSHHLPMEELVRSKDWQSFFEITGSVTHSEMLSYMNHADLIVIPSLSEGLGVTAIEALMLGKPVLASDAGGLPEVVVPGKTGTLYKAGDAYEMIKCLKKVLLGDCRIDSDLQREFYLKNFTRQQHIATLQQYLRTFSN